MIRKTSNKLVCHFCGAPAKDREDGLPVCLHCKEKASSLMGCFKTRKNKKNNKLEE